MLAADPLSTLEHCSAAKPAGASSKNIGLDNICHNIYCGGMRLKDAEGPSRQSHRLGCVVFFITRELSHAKALNGEDRPPRGGSLCPME